MSLYIEQIKQLVVLQTVDSEMIGLEHVLEEVPKKLQELQEKKEYLQEQQNIIQEKINVLMEQKNRLEFEIENDTQKIKKSKNKLLLVENTKEYHAMVREMDNLEKMNRLRDEEKNNLQADLSDLEGRKDSLQKDIDELASTISTQQATLDSEMAGNHSRLKVLNKDKAKASQAVPAPILTRYNFIRDRIPNPVIVPVSEGICQGCRIAIPPQAFIDLQKGEQILSCPNCQRIIYWERHFSETE